VSSEQAGITGIAISKRNRAVLATADWMTITIRLGAATLLGLVIGLEREWRGHDAGVRTHALVSLSSAMITVSSLLLFDDLRSHGGQGDPLRVIQGLAQAIGFIAGGLIFIRGGGVRNMTTAASLWMSAAIGIGSGAGQFLLVGIATCFAILLLLTDLLLKRILPRANEHDDSLPASPSSRRGTSRTPE
jgi:putative Mg2+ transporter-C (MgtC) family protein